MTSATNRALYDFWRDKHFLPDTAEMLTRVFWKCSVSDVLAMPDAEINRRMDEDSFIKGHNKILALRYVHKAQNSQAHSHNPHVAHSHTGKTSSTVNSYFV